MRFEPEVYNLTNGGAGLLLAAMGVYVAIVRPRRTGNVTFGLFLACFGTSYVLTHFADAVQGWPAAASMALPGPLWAAAALLLVPALARFPLPMDRSGRASFAAVAAAAVASTALLAAVYVQAGAGGDGGRPAPSGPVELAGTAGTIAFFLMLFALHGASLVAALRFRSMADGWQRRRLGLVGLALSLYLGSVAGSGGFTFGASPFDPSPAIRTWTVLNFLWLAALVVAWLANTREGAQTALARNVALTHMGMTALGLVVALNGDEILGQRGIFHGVARLLAFAVLAYAVLKGRLLGLDRPVRWAVKSSTVGVAFVGVFLVAGKVAENLAQGYAESEGVGIVAGAVAAGLLLLALHPLERMAQRFAERAVPPTDVATDRVELYREQATLAWRDGKLTRQEHRLLAHLRTRLGVPAEVAARIESEAAGAAAEGLRRRNAPRRAGAAARAR